MTDDEVIDVRRDAVTIDLAAGETVLTRNRLRRELLRLVVGRRQRQVTPDMPALLVMHPNTWEDLMLDYSLVDPLDEMPLLPDRRKTFRGLPIQEAYAQPEHTVEVRWT